MVCVQRWLEEARPGRCDAANNTHSGSWPLSTTEVGSLAAAAAACTVKCAAYALCDYATLSLQVRTCVWTHGRTCRLRTFKRPGDFLTAPGCNRSQLPLPVSATCRTFALRAEQRMQTLITASVGFNASLQQRHRREQIEDAVTRNASAFITLKSTKKGRRALRKALSAGCAGEAL